MDTHQEYCSQKDALAWKSQNVNMQKRANALKPALLLIQCHDLYFNIFFQGNFEFVSTRIKASKDAAR